MITRSLYLVLISTQNRMAKLFFNVLNPPPDGGQAPAGCLASSQMAGKLQPGVWQANPSLLAEKRSIRHLQIFITMLIISLLISLGCTQSQEKIGDTWNLVYLLTH